MNAFHNIFMKYKIFPKLPYIFIVNINISHFQWIHKIIHIKSEPESGRRLRAPRTEKRPRT